MRTVDLVRPARLALIVLLYLTAAANITRAVLIHLDADGAWVWLGWDALAYHRAWQGEMYDVDPGLPGAYNYSPLFAQLVWPLAQLPEVWFRVVFVAAAAVGIGWLLRGTRPLVAVGFALLCLPEVFSGNVFWLIAVCTVVGTTRAAAWGWPAVTKVVPAVGALWFVGRGEWRELLRGVALWGALVLASAAVSPEQWVAWWEFLTDNSHRTTSGYAVNVAVAASVVLLAGRLGQRWLIPFALVLASPVPGAGTFALLAALPRLWALDARQPGGRGALLPRRFARGPAADPVGRP